MLADAERVRRDLQHERTARSPLGPATMEGHMRRSIVALWPLVLIGCSEPLPHVAHYECVRRAAEILDDGVSQPEIVAARVSAACIVEKRKMVEAMLTGLNVAPSGESMQASLNYLEVEKGAVLFVRSVRAQEQQPKAP